MSNFARRMTPLWCALLFAGTILLSNPQTGVVSKSPSVIINISPPPLLFGRFISSPPPPPPSPPPPPPSPSPPPPPPSPSPPPPPPSPIANFGGSLIEFIVLDIPFATYSSSQQFFKPKITQIFQNLLGYGSGSVNVENPTPIPYGVVSTNYLVDDTTNLNTLPTLAKNFAQTAISSIAGSGVKSIDFTYLSDGTIQYVLYYIDETTDFTMIPSSIKDFGDNLIPDSKKSMSNMQDAQSTTVGTVLLPLKIYVPLAEIANARSKFLNLFTSPTIGAPLKPTINSLFYNTYMQIPAVYLVDQITASQFTGMATSGINPTDVSSWQHSDSGEVMAINIPYATYMSNVGENNGKITLALTELLQGDYVFITSLQESTTAGTTLVSFDIVLPATSSTAITNTFAQFESYFVDCNPAQGNRIGCPSGPILTQKLQSYGLPGAFYNQQPAAAPYTMRGYSNSYYSLRDDLRRNILGKDVEGEFN